MIRCKGKKLAKFQGFLASVGQRIISKGDGTTHPRPWLGEHRGQKEGGAKELDEAKAKLSKG